MDQVLDTDDVVLAQDRLNDGVVCEGDPVLVDLQWAAQLTEKDAQYSARSLPVQGHTVQESCAATCKPAGKQAAAAPALQLRTS